MNISEQLPQWGINYHAGCIGFVSRKKDVIAEGIDWFSRWDDVSRIPICHALVISAEYHCIEAHARLGVNLGNLFSYISDPDCSLFIRTPIGWTLDAGNEIAAEAHQHLGEAYGYGTILADALANTFAGHWLNKLLLNAPDRIVSRLLDNPRREVCSELVANALLPVIGPVGCLRENPPCMITPQMLFEDNTIFASGATELVSVVEDER